MAELAKKLHFLKNGTEQTAKAYSTTDEVGSIYIPSKIDGVACYIPVGSVSDAMATNGRVIKSGTTYAIKSQAKPAYAEQSWTTAGTYTWTCPSGVSRIRVAVCGGGGGGAYTKSGTVSADQGGSSEFGSLISATGGKGGNVIRINTGAFFQGGEGGSPNGRAGSAARASSAVSGGTGFALSFNLTDGSYGNGGASSGSSGTRAGGGSGGYDSSYVNVSPNQSYTVVVGAGGNGNGGDSGKSGFVLIAYGGDI